jgi:hypothetical protein
VKLPDATVVSVKAFASGNNKDDILHWATIFRLFEQKGLKEKWDGLSKAVKDQLGILENVQKSLGPKIQNETLEDGDKLELDGTKKLAVKKQAKFLKAIQRPFNLVPQLLIGEA